MKPFKADTRIRHRTTGTIGTIWKILRGGDVLIGWAYAKEASRYSAAFLDQCEVVP